MTTLFIPEGNWEERMLRLKAMLEDDGDNHEALAELEWLEFQNGLTDRARINLEKFVTLCPDDAIYLYRLGLLYWKVGESSHVFKTKAVECLLRSAKLNPSQTDVFRHLGHFYTDLGETRRAVRCYQRAIALKPEDEEAGEALRDALSTGDQDVLLTAICREASQRSAHAFWACRCLGFLQVHQKDWSGAVISLQHALRGYPKDAQLWEALGLAYQQLGMFTASLKAYERVLILGSHSTLFSLLQTGNILLSLAFYQKAIDTFQMALDIVPNLLGAKYGLAASLLARARECIKQAAYAWGAKLLEEASDLASHCAHDFGNLTVVWKLLGDIEVEYVQALPCKLWLIADAPIERNFANSIISTWYEKRKTAAKRAVQAYQHALHLQPFQGLFYADLGIALKLLHSLTKSCGEKSLSRDSPTTVVCGGLHLDTVNPDIWVIYGMVSEHRGMQQHAFIQALQLDGNHAVSWAQLGQLYLKEGDINLAAQSFERARAANTMLALPWAGMSMIHSSKGSSLNLEEAFESCLYAVTLSPLVDYKVGLAKISAETKKIHLSQVYASIQQAALHSPDRPEALNLVGLASECRGLLRMAIRSFSLARLLLTELEEGSSMKSYKYVAVSLNVARVFLKAGNNKNAVIEYQKLNSTGKLRDELEGQLYFALALWRSDHHDEAVKLAKQILKAATLGTHHHIAALHLVFQFLYHLSGAIPTLEQIWKLPSEVFADERFSYLVIAISIATGRDDNLGQVVERCPVVFNLKNASTTHSLLASGKQIMQNQYEPFNKACSYLVKAVHLYPNSIVLRSKLGKALLSSTNGFKASLATRFCLSCMLREVEDTTDDLKCSILVEATLACSACVNIQPILTIPVCCSAGQCHASILQILQRWLHREPWNIMAKYSVILTLMQQAREHKFPSGLCKSIFRLADTVLAFLSNNEQDNPVSAYIHVQLLLCMSECLLKSKDYTKAIELLATASKSKAHPSNMPYIYLQLARCYGLRQDFSAQNVELKNWHLRSCRKDFIGQLLATELELQLASNSEKHVVVTSRKLTFSEEKSEVKYVWHALLQVILAHACIRGGDLAAAEVAAAEASQLWPNNPALDLFHGSVCIELRKLGFAPEYISSAIDSLKKASHGKHGPIPISNALLAKAQSTRGTSSNSSSSKWDTLIRKEWEAWPPDLRPAEIYFQMGLLVKRLKGSSEKSADGPEMFRTARSWIQRAVHMNPSCHRYWVMVGMMKEAKDFR